MALTQETPETTVQPEPVVERITHDPAPPAPGADAQKPKPDATDDTANAAEGAAETTEQSEEHKQSKFQRRLDRQKAARYQAEAQANSLREERDRLRAQLDGQARQQQDAGSNTNTGAPTRDQYPDYEEYLRACARWDSGQETDKRLKAEREEREAREKQQQAERLEREHFQKVGDSWREREKAFKASAPDFEEKANEFLDDGAERLYPDARALLIESDLGPQLLYHLANNPDEVERLAELSPRRQLIELGKLEDKLPKVNGKRTTNAPPPASTVRQGANFADGLRENMTQAEVRAHMKKHGSRWVS